MIFDNDYTKLSGGAAAIPMAEGYDCSYGAALALVESARNDFAMFNAMMKIESRSSAIMRESTGVVQEGELQALQEASIKGIWSKIKELFYKLLAKIKAIFHNFMAKINSLFMKDKDLVKKYEKEVLRKTNINNLEVKWRNMKSSTPSTKNDYDVNKGWEGWNSEVDERRNHFLDGCDFEDLGVNEFLEDEEEVKLSEIGGIRTIITKMKGSKDTLKDLEKKYNEAERNVTKIVKDADDKLTKINKDSEQAEIDNANHAYDMAVAYQEVTLKYLNTSMDATKAIYKYTKAAFMKAVTVNTKKLEEEALYLDFVAEAAEDEVEEVIQGAIDSNCDSTDLTSTSVASTNVIDGDVSNDPDANLADYGKGTDTEYEKDKVDGSVDTDYNGKESAFFGQLFY